jgi:hypothetical protein
VQLLLPEHPAAAADLPLLLLLLELHSPHPAAAAHRTY